MGGEMKTGKEGQEALQTDRAVFISLQIGSIIERTKFNLSQVFNVDDDSVRETVFCKVSHYSLPTELRKCDNDG